MPEAQPAEDWPKEATTPVDAAPPPLIACLRAGYGDAIERVENEGSNWVVVLAGGTRLLWDDETEKSFEERLNSPDLEDQLSILYPVGETTSPEENDDPGRFRVEAFFKAVYGDTKERVRDNLTIVPWLPKRIGKKLRFNKRNGAAKALMKVSLELDERLPKSALRYISQPAGTFNWRYVAGTKRLSAHAFGIAVDINLDVSHYWRWEMHGHPLVYKNRVPFQIVEVFEKHGFIWGGKWYHYDTMHFEYRPELLASGCLR